MNGAKHLEQALSLLQPGGRLVAIVGEGMAHDKSAFRDWWKGIEQKYAVRANIGIEGASYVKYGTTFDNQILVIDKIEPDGKPIVTGKVAHPKDALQMLEEVRNERQKVDGRGVLNSKGQVGKDDTRGTTVPKAPKGTVRGMAGSGVGSVPAELPDGRVLQGEVTLGGINTGSGFQDYKIGDQINILEA